MRFPRPDLSRYPWLAKVPLPILLAVPFVVLFIGALGIALARGGSSNSDSIPPALSVRVGPDVAPTVVPTRTAVPITPTVVAPNRQSCTQIQGTSYLSDAERDWYQANCSTARTAGLTPTASASRTATTTTASAAPTARPQATAAPAAAAAPPPAPTGSYVSGKAPGPVADTLRLTRLGVDGPVHTSVVGPAGQMGDPDGKDDIVWYDFSSFPGFGGYPGMGGNAVLAGHVDYHPNFQAVFWYIRDARAGDVIDYYTAAGKHLTYTVDWVKETGPEDDFSDYVAQTGRDIMTIITCDGAFNSVTRHYDKRTVVRAHLT